MEEEIAKIEAMEQVDNVPHYDLTYDGERSSEYRISEDLGRLRAIGSLKSQIGVEWSEACVESIEFHEIQDEN